MENSANLRRISSHDRKRNNNGNKGQRVLIAARDTILLKHISIPKYSKPPLRKRTRAEFLTIVIGGSLLAFNAGFMNAVTLELNGLTVTHVTGTLTKSAVYVASGNYMQFYDVFLLVPCFMLGSMITALLVKSQSFHLGRQYLKVFLIGTIILAGGCLLKLFYMNNLLYEYTVAIVCGMQNAMTTKYSDNILRTTHATGSVTDIGVVMGHMIRGVHSDSWKLQVLVPLVCFFFGGGMTGHVVTEWLGEMAIFSNVIIFGGTGLLYLFYLTHLRNISHIKKFYPSNGERKGTGDSPGTGTITTTPTNNNEVIDNNIQHTDHHLHHQYHLNRRMLAPTNHLHYHSSSHSMTSNSSDNSDHRTKSPRTKSPHTKSPHTKRPGDSGTNGLLPPLPTNTAVNHPSPNDNSNTTPLNLNGDTNSTTRCASPSINTAIDSGGIAMTPLHTNNSQKSNNNSNNNNLMLYDSQHVTPYQSPESHSLSLPPLSSCTRSQGLSIDTDLDLDLDSDTDINTGENSPVGQCSGRSSRSSSFQVGGETTAVINDTSTGDAITPVSDGHEPDTGCSYDSDSDNIESEVYYTLDDVDGGYSEHDEHGDEVDDDDGRHLGTDYHELSDDEERSYYLNNHIYTHKKPRKKNVKKDKRHRKHGGERGDATCGGLKSSGSTSSMRKWLSSKLHGSMRSLRSGSKVSEDGDDVSSSGPPPMKNTSSSNKNLLTYHRYVHHQHKKEYRQAIDDQTYKRNHRLTRSKTL